MEREPSFSYQHPPERSSERRVGVLSTEREILEYLQTPENAAELQAYWEYLLELNRFILGHIPGSEQAQALREAHVAIDRPRAVAGNLPPTQLTGRVFPIGNHMDFTVGLRADTQWPDPRRDSLALNDGAIITPDTPVGIVDYYRNIAKLNRDRSLIGFTRELVADMTASLGVLATEVQRLDTSAAVVQAISGMSHLVRLGHRFGFTVFDIADSGRRERATSTSFRIASRIASNNPEWQQLSERYKPAQVGIISRQDLVRRYSSNP